MSLSLVTDVTASPTQKLTHGLASFDVILAQVPQAVLLVSIDALPLLSGTFSNIVSGNQCGYCSFLLLYRPDTFTH